MQKKILQHYKDLDHRLVQVAKTVKILTALAWKPTIAQKFLKELQAGKPRLPKLQLTPPDFSTQRAELKEILKHCDVLHPLGRFLHDTALAYLQAAEMLEHVGKPTFTKRSADLYGLPTDAIDASGLSTLKAAEDLIGQTREYITLSTPHADDVCLLPEYVASRIQHSVNEMFKKHTVEVVVDPQLSSKAAASAKRIRVRSFTCFSEMDIPQLIHHEAFVHTLTGINGREQPNLTSLGADSPRTTRTQEGIAVFAELITNSMDLHRLRRISLRVKAVDMALNGADFLDIFNFFLEAGQTDIESFQSTARIFRGGDVRGKIIFTKDIVYLQGFVQVHHFLQRAMQSGKVMYPHYLCAGKLSVDDVHNLEPYFESGFIAKPIYQPTWITNRSSLLAFLLYSAFAKELRLN